MRDDHTFIESLFKFSFFEVFVKRAKWRGLLEWTFTRIAESMTTMAIELRQGLAGRDIVGQDWRD